jgi:hypothetical protein
MAELLEEEEAEKERERQRQEAAAAKKKSKKKKGKEKATVAAAAKVRFAGPPRRPGGGQGLQRAAHGRTRRAAWGPCKAVLAAGTDGHWQLWPLAGTDS